MLLNLSLGPSPAEREAIFLIFFLDEKDFLNKKNVIKTLIIKRIFFEKKILRNGFPLSRRGTEGEG